MNTSEFLLRIIGIGDAKYRMIWFMLAILRKSLFSNINNIITDMFFSWPYWQHDCPH